MTAELRLFQSIISRFTHAVESNDGEGLAQLFSEDGCYSDEFYGEFKGRSEISLMLREYFWGHAEGFKWDMSNLACDGEHGYATYFFSYTSKLPSAKGKRIAFEGISHFSLVGDLIRRYDEVFNTGVALVQLNFESERLVRHLQKKSEPIRRQLI